jgi:signal transduction histidine kinase
VNAAYARAVEAAREDVVKGEGIEFASRAVGPRARDLAADAIARGETAREKRFVVVDGQRRAFDIIEVPLSERGTIGFAIDVTALDEARADLARHIDGHAETLDRLGTAIAIFGPDKRLGYYNSAYAKLWGLAEDWLDGQPQESEVLERLRETRLLPEQADFPAWKRQRMTLYTTAIEPREEFWYLPDGRTLREVCQPHPFGGLLFFYEDVTDRLALERSHNTLIAVQGATLDKLYEGVAVFGSDGRLKLSNPAYAKFWKLPPEAIDGEPHIAEIIDLTRDLLTEEADEWPDVRAHMIQIVTEREARSGRMERPDGSVIDFAASHLPDGAMLLAYLDVTDSTRIERALRERNEALETADQLKTDFISNVSYELRTPLNTIIGFGEILDQEYFGSLNPRQHEYSQGILHSSNQLLSLVNDILDLATIEAGAMTLERTRVVVADMLQNVAHLMAEQGRKHQLQIEVDCAVPPDEAVEADERRLKQVLVNLVSNAIKYTLPGGIITLGATRGDDMLSLFVSDTGIGIDPRLHETVFERFETAGERRRGAGLGLSLVRSFVELHGGDVRLESMPGVGTRVTCYLPLPALNAAAEPARAASAASS